MKSLLTIDELANVLGRSPRSIRKTLRSNPDAVPAPLRLPKTRILRWRPELVERWLELQAPHVHDQSIGVGR